MKILPFFLGYSRVHAPPNRGENKKAEILDIISEIFENFVFVNSRFCQLIFYHTSDFSLSLGIIFELFFKNSCFLKKIPPPRFEEFLENWSKKTQI